MTTKPQTKSGARRNADAATPRLIRNQHQRRHEQPTTDHDSRNADGDPAGTPRRAIALAQAARAALTQAADDAALSVAMDDLNTALTRPPGRTTARPGAARTGRRRCSPCPPF